MLCPSCKTETKIQEVKTEYIYPNLFLGMPTFWAFMTPATARVVTIGIALLGVIMAVMGILLLINGSNLGFGPLLIFAITIYSVLVCVRSLKDYRMKRYYRCLSCRLDWYEYIDEEAK